MAVSDPTIDSKTTLGDHGACQNNTQDLEDQKEAQGDTGSQLEGADKQLPEHEAVTAQSQGTAFSSLVTQVMGDRTHFMDQSPAEKLSVSKICHLHFLLNFH